MGGSGLEDMLIRLLQATAIRMEPPRVYGVFHIAIVAVLVIAAVAAARLLRGKSEQTRIRILTAVGWILLIMEIYKQLFYYYIVNGGAYDYWFLPFQLCSIPMYLCILLPWVKGRLRETFLTFMLGYVVVGAVSTFIYPADMMRPYLFLTLHGFVWHGLLLFISFLIGYSGMADLSLKGFARSTALFCVLCVIAIVLNVITEPIAANTIVNGSPSTYPNAFYLNPYHLSRQPIVEPIQNALGRPAGMLVYVLAIIGLAGMIDWIFYKTCGSRTDASGAAGSSITRH